MKALSLYLSILSSSYLFSFLHWLYNLFFYPVVHTSLPLQRQPLIKTVPYPQPPGCPCLIS